MSDVAIRVERLAKRYRLGERHRHRTLREALVAAARAPFARRRGAAEGELWALRDITFEVRRGEVLGVIGRNGAGKSTLLKLLARITEPTAGRIELNGRLGSLLEVGTGFHSELTGRENIFLSGAILGMRKAEIERKFDEIVAFAEVERFVDTPVKHFSTGMYLRLAFAVAAHLEPEILLIDEVLAVGDAAFQKKCLGKMSDVSRQGRTVLFVSHNLAAVQSLCSRALLIEGGLLAAIGPISDVVPRYVETLAAIQTMSLGSRHDRVGNGDLRFVDLALRPATAAMAGPAICGAPAELVLRYEGLRRKADVQVSVAVFTTLGEGCLFFDSEMAGTPLASPPATGEMVCTFDRLPLLPGTYTANIYCTVGGELADWVVGAGKLEVVEGDFFGSGKLPPAGYGHVVAAHRWRIREVPCLARQASEHGA